MLPDCGVNDAAVEENLGRVGNVLKHPQGLFELIVVVVVQRLDPRLDFLAPVSPTARGEGEASGIPVSGT